MTKRKDGSSAKTLEWYLRRASEQDSDALYELLCVPEVYRYLCDGAPPPREQVEQWVELNREDNAASGQGLWLLENDVRRLAGCVTLDAGGNIRTGELVYLLHPKYWGQGLATRMSWAVVERVFREGLLDRIVAGADTPNHASIAVMRRLGMKYLRDVSYPLGQGVEYVLRHDDPKPIPEPDPFPWCA